MNSVRREGHRDRGSDLLLGPTTAYDLLAADASGPLRSPEVHVPDELLADLDYYPLVITPDYVGRDRRAPGARHRRDRGGHGTSVRTFEILAVIVATVCAVVPLTLMASHTAVAGPSSGRSKASGSSPASGVHTVSLERSAATHRNQEARAQARARKQRAQRAQRAQKADQARRARQARQARQASVASVRRQARAERAARASRASRAAEYRRAHRDHARIRHRKAATPAGAQTD